MEFLKTNQRAEGGVNSASELPQIQLSRFFFSTSYISELIYDNHEEIQWLNSERNTKNWTCLSVKLSMTIHAHFSFKKCYCNGEKDVSSTYTILLLVIYSMYNHKQLLQ